MAIAIEMPALSKEQLLQMYRQMWDDPPLRRPGHRAVPGRPDPRLDPPYIGMEAVGVGACAALRPDDTSPAPTAATATASPRAATRR